MSAFHLDSAIVMLTVVLSVSCDEFGVYNKELKPISGKYQIVANERRHTIEFRDNGVLVVDGELGTWSRSGAVVNLSGPRIPPATAGSQDVYFGDASLGSRDVGETAIIVKVSASEVVWRRHGALDGEQTLFRLHQRE